MAAVVGSSRRERRGEGGRWAGASAAPRRRGRAGFELEKNRGTSTATKTKRWLPPGEGSARTTPPPEAVLKEARWGLSCAPAGRSPGHQHGGGATAQGPTKEEIFSYCPNYRLNLFSCGFWFDPTKGRTWQFGRRQKKTHWLSEIRREFVLCAQCQVLNPKTKTLGNNFSSLDPVILGKSHEICHKARMLGFEYDQGPGISAHSLKKN